MKFYFTLLIVFIVSCLQAQTREEIATQFINDLSSQKFQEAESLTDSLFQAKANENILKALWQQTSRQLGTYHQIDSARKYIAGAYIVFLDFARAKQKFIISFNKEGKITGLGNGGTQFKNITPDTSVYPQQNLSVNVKGGTIKGSLMLPEKVSAGIPVALIIAGSGPTDRNGNSTLVNAKFNTYKLLAEALAKNGIASFRYDKRMIGESNNFVADASKYRFEDMVNDADSIVQFLKMKYSKVYIIGHSEGSLIGILSSQKENPSGLISIAGAGENIATTLKRQTSQMPDAASADSILTLLSKGNYVNNIPDDLQNIFNPSVQPYLISWMQYEPQKEIKKLHCPVLLLQGDKDRNVTVHDAENLKKAKPDAKLVIIHGIDHELRNPVADIQQYAEQPLNKQLTDSIVSFIKQ